jgi:hypothetical protein
MMNVKLLAASALLVQSGLLSIFCSCPMFKPTQLCSAPAGHKVISTTLAAPQRELCTQFCLRKGRQITTVEQRRTVGYSDYDVF